MIKWQLISSAGITLGFKEAVTASRAVTKWREDMDHHENYYDYMYKFSVDGNKINFIKPSRLHVNSPGVLKEEGNMI